MFALRRSVVASRQAVRSFSVAAPARKDFVQDLYIKELKAYKPSPSKIDSASIKSYSTPASPTAPVVPDAAALASELAEYDAAAPAQDSPAAATSPSVTESGDVEGADEYLAAVQADVKTEAKH